MNPIQALSGPMLMDLWRDSWQIGLKILAVLALQLLLRPWLIPRWRYGLWLLVAARLALPVTLELPGALFDWGRSWAHSGSGDLNQPPAWLAPLRDKLDRTTVEFELVNAAIDQLADLMRATLEVNVLIDPQLYDEVGGHELNLVGGQPSSAELLDQACRTLDPEIDWCLTRGLIHIGWRYDLPELRDLRFYRIAPLLGDGTDPDEVVYMIQAFTGDHGRAWEIDGVSIEV